MLQLLDLLPDPKNPRFIRDSQFEHLVKSLREFPKMMELRPIIVDSEGVIIGGNMRYRALVHLGYTEIPDAWVKRASDLTEKEIERFQIADNLSFGEWDFDRLANEWQPIELAEWGLALPELDMPTIADIYKDPAEASDASSKPGQLILTFPSHQLEQVKRLLKLHGDTPEESILKLLAIT